MNKLNILWQGAVLITSVFVINYAHADTVCIGNINKSEPVFCNNVETGQGSVTIGNGNLSFTHNTDMNSSSINTPQQETNDEGEDNNE